MAAPAPRVLTLYPYLLDGLCWVFDDERTGLKEEAFVLGMTEMISRVVEAKAIPNAARGFEMSFSDRPFAGHDVELEWLRPDPAGGNWYAGTVVGEPMEGWLCPALLLYFRDPPPGSSCGAPRCRRGSTRSGCRRRAPSPASSWSLQAARHEPSCSWRAP